MAKTTRNHIILYGFLTAVALFTSIKYGIRLWNGGHYYVSADWLIHFEGGLVRRGFSGELFMGLGAWTKTNPLIFLGVFQLSINAFLFYIPIYLFKDRELSNTELMLIVSPAFYGLWLFQSSAAMRKEILPLLAFALVLMGYKKLSKSPWLYVAASSSMAIGFFFHEGMVFFLPFFLLLLGIGYKEGILSLHALLSHSILLSVFAAAAVIFTLAFPHVADNSQMCANLMAWDMKENICDGAIRYTTQNSQDGLALVEQHYLSQPFKIVGFIFGYLLALLPLSLYSIGHISRKQFLRALPFGILAFLPLFVVAVDWGRWVFFYVASLSYIIIACRLFGKAHVKTEVHGGLVFIFCTSWFLSASYHGFRIPILDAITLITG